MYSGQATDYDKSVNIAFRGKVMKKMDRQLKNWVREEGQSEAAQAVMGDIQKAQKHAMARVETHAQEFIVPSVNALKAWSMIIPGADCSAEKFYNCVVAEQEENQWAGVSWKCRKEAGCD